ncbi:MAG: HAMP domain-containing histidine kinase [Candidatus Vogelbacteria bacterium]|nr:HAMP domain-containing histidine kinase [Candidatus Vogelbacteria bacterium]
MNPRRNKIKIRVWATIVGGTIVLVVVSFVLYQHTVNLLTANLRQRIESIARSTAPSFDPRDIEELRTESDWQKPAWNKVVNQLLAIEQSHTDILFAYIFRKKVNDPSLMEFVADSHSIDPYANTDSDPSNDVDANRDGKIEPDGPDYLQWPGQDYEDPPEGSFRAYEVGPTTSKELYEDSFGRVITGYAPIVSNGETIAVLAFDMKADDFFVITRQTLYPFLGFISFLVLIILLLFSFIIRMWRNQLRKEVAQREHIENLASELERANEKLKELDKVKTEFVSIATHQLRAPLTAIKGYASMILEGSFGAINGKAKEAVDIVFQSSQKLVSVIEDFLNITRIELGKMKYELTDFDLKQLVESALKENAPSIARKGLTFKFNTDGHSDYKINADYGKLAQVVNNLIDNALKYTEAGSLTVTLSKVGGKTRLAIADTGVGIPPETMEKLFQKFTRAADASKSNLAGTGLGLYVAKQIIEAHHGRLWAESDGVGQGSTFIVEL